MREKKREEKRREEKRIPEKRREEKRREDQRREHKIIEGTKRRRERTNTYTLPSMCGRVVFIPLARVANKALVACRQRGRRRAHTTGVGALTSASRRFPSRR